MCLTRIEGVWEIRKSVCFVATAGTLLPLLVMAVFARRWGTGCARVIVTGIFITIVENIMSEGKNKHAYKLGDVFELFGRRFVVKRPHGRHSCDGCAFYPFCAADEAFAKEVESRVISCAQQIYVEL